METRNKTMNQPSFQLKGLLLIMIITISLSFCSCESDPILSPQIEVEEEAGGSYGNTNIPVSNAQNSDTVLTSKTNSNRNQNRRAKANPKLF